MVDTKTFIFENIPLCFSKDIKTNNNILRGNMDSKYFGFKLSNISIINKENTFNLEISGTTKEIEIVKYWMFSYLGYLYKKHHK